MDNVPHTTLIACFAVTALITVRKWKKSSNQLPLPPGPPNYPFIGQLLSMPLSSEHTTFDRQGKDIRSSWLYLIFILCRCTDAFDIKVILYL